MGWSQLQGRDFLRFGSSPFLLRTDQAAWEFIFLGANIDAAREAERFGIHRSRAVRYENDCIGTRINYSVMSCEICGKR